MREYLRPNSEMCGLLMRWKWVDEKLTPPSKDMKVGSYFEFQVSGALPKDKLSHYPEYQKSKPNELYEPWAKAQRNALRVKKYIADMGLEVIQSGVTLHHGRYKGTIDLICRATKRIEFEDGFVLNIGDEIIIDLKYSGLLDDRWSVHGWMWTDEQREYHGTQAIHYHMIGKRPFFFLVCSSKNETDIKFFRVEVSEQSIERHKMEANELYGQLEVIEMSNRWIPRPSLSKCLECPLNSTCTVKHTYPHPELVLI